MMPDTPGVGGKPAQYGAAQNTECSLNHPASRLRLILAVGLFVGSAVAIARIAHGRPAVGPALMLASGVTGAACIGVLFRRMLLISIETMAAIVSTWFTVLAMVLPPAVALPAEPGVIVQVFAYLAFTAAVVVPYIRSGKPPEGNLLGLFRLWLPLAAVAWLVYPLLAWDSLGVIGRTPYLACAAVAVWLLAAERARRRGQRPAAGT